MTVARALAVLATLGIAAAAPATAQMPTGIVGGMDLLQESRTPGTSAAPAASSDRTSAPGTRAMGGAGTISLDAVSASPGGAVPAPVAMVPNAGAQVAMAAPAAEPGAPIRVRRTQVVAGEAVRATADTAVSPGGRLLGPGAPIVIPADADRDGSR